MSKAEASVIYSDTGSGTSIPACASPAAAWPAGHADPPARTAVIYDKTIPRFAAEALDRLHGSIYATLDHLQIEEELGDANAYVSRERGDIKGMLLFRKEQGVAIVLNQLLALDGDELQRFADTVFDNDASLSAIMLTAVRTDVRCLRHPHQCHRFTEDIVATLPPSAEAFLASLGKNTRETVKRFTRKVQHAFPSFRFEIHTDDEIGIAQARELYRLHRSRMRVKHTHSDVSEREFANIVELARRRGIMTTAMIDGRICGGLICWRVGRDYFMRIIAHDPHYDDFKLGSVCCYLTMRECIARKGKSFHFLFGRVPYKYRFLGEGRVFDQVVIYRSRLAMARQWRLASRTAASGLNRDLRLWLLDAEGRNDLVARTAMTAIRAWRKVRNFKGKLP